MNFHIMIHFNIDMTVSIHINIHIIIYIDISNHINTNKLCDHDLREFMLTTVVLTRRLKNPGLEPPVPTAYFQRIRSRSGRSATSKC